MLNLSSMFSAHPGRPTMNQEMLGASVEEILRCSAVCASCADACLGDESAAELRRCIRTNLDCADVCAATAMLLSRQTEPDPLVLRAQVQACAEICSRCADECEAHGEHMEHCRMCAETCRNCTETCNKLLAQIGTATYA